MPPKQLDSSHQQLNVGSLSVVMHSKPRSSLNRPMAVAPWKVLVLKLPSIGRRTQAFFLKTKLKIGEKLANVSITKFVLTKTKERATPEEAAIVQRVMCHSQNTAECAYMRTSLTKLGSQSLHIIARVTSKAKPETEKGDDIKTEKQPASANKVKPSTRTKVVEESTPDAN